MAQEGNLKEEVLPSQVAARGGISSSSCECVGTEGWSTGRAVEAVGETVGEWSVEAVGAASVEWYVTT